MENKGRTGCITLKMIQNVFDSDQGCAGSYEIVINSITRIVMFIVQLQQKFIVIRKCLINTVSLI